jgi:hypothetical protein
VALAGSFQILMLYDVADAIRLDELRRILGLGGPDRLPQFTHRTPEYVRFERPPVIQPINPSQIGADEHVELRAKYYDYGVISIESGVAFEGDWTGLVERSSRWIDAPGIESRCMECVRRCLAAAAPALVNPYADWLNEDYYVIHLKEVQDPDGRPATAADLISSHGGEIAQIVRGESTLLAESERQEILQSRISYYRSDLVVVGWKAALVYDSVEGAAPTIQLLEYANTQLLEFRHYDNLLTRVLGEVYKLTERRRGLLSRWRLAQQAERLNTIRLEVMEIAERTDNSIKFLSDMFYARLYRLAAAKVGVQDYKNLVDQKLRAAAELYRFMVDQFQESRAFLLELIVVFILVIEIVLAFKGRF